MKALAVRRAFRSTFRPGHPTGAPRETAYRRPERVVTMNEARRTAKGFHNEHAYSSC